jgi:hypothetical protein
VRSTDPTCLVFLLHAGTAAAGLTLTAARHVFLLEPFLSAAEEAQAFNRCHRIGQSQAVTVTTYFVRGSVEERILGYRRLSGEAAAGGDVQSSGLAAGMGGGDSHGMTAAKLRCIFGLADTCAAVEALSDDSGNDDDDDDDGQDSDVSLDDD